MQILVEKEQFLSTYKNETLGLRTFNKYRSWFPVRSSAALAGIVADITSDGHLQYTSPRCDYISGDLNELKRFSRELYDLFGYKGYVDESKTNPYSRSYWYRVNCQAIGRVLSLCGTPSGCKVKKKFDVPEWIKNGEPEIRRTYLRRIFSCEGHVRLQKRRIIIGVKYGKIASMQSDLNNFLMSLKNMLLLDDIKATNPYISDKYVRKDGLATHCMAFEIHGTKDNMHRVVNFKKYINFDFPKCERLKKCMDALN